MNTDSLTSRSRIDNIPINQTCSHKRQCWDQGQAQDLKSEDQDQTVKPMTKTKTIKKQHINTACDCEIQIELHKPGQMQFSILVVTNAIYKYVLHLAEVSKANQVQY